LSFFFFSQEIRSEDGRLEECGSQCVEYMLDVFPIGGAGDVGEDLLEWIGVLLEEDILDEDAGVFKVLATGVFGEADVQVGRQDFLFEQILLVQEENDGGVDEPLVVADFLEQLERFHHAVGGFIFIEHQIIFGEGDAEDGCGDILETVHPFLAFGALSAHVDHAIMNVINVEFGLCDACRLGAAVDNVDFVWTIRRVLEAINVFEKILDTIDQLEFRRASERGLDGRVFPQQLEEIGDLASDRVTEVFFEGQQLIGCLSGFRLEFEIEVG